MDQSPAEILEQSESLAQQHFYENWGIFRIVVLPSVIQQVQRALQPAFPDIQWMGTDRESSWLHAELGKENTQLSHEQEQAVENLPHAWYTKWHTYLAPRYNEEQEKRYRQAFLAQALIEGARYWCIEWKEPSGMRVLNREGFQTLQQAERNAQKLEKSLSLDRSWNGVITVRLAFSREDAEKGRFLDDDFLHCQFPLPWKKEKENG